MDGRDTFRQLVEYLKAFRSLPSEHKAVFWLGAGCSVYDEVPLMDELIRRVLASSITGWGSLQFQFDQFCETLGPAPNRARFLRPYFERTIRPDSPYLGLARLLQKGYADLVFTFNIDDLLEQALDQTGLRLGTDYRVIKVPEMRVDAVRTMVNDYYGPRVRVVKLHGDYRLGFNNMTSSEIVAYETKIRDLVHDSSQLTAVVCGYSFFHLNVLNAFSMEGGSFFYVNRSFPDAPMVLSLMRQRSKAPLFIDAPLGLFETFIAELEKALP